MQVALSNLYGVLLVGALLLGIRVEPEVPNSLRIEHVLHERPAKLNLEASKTWAEAGWPYAAVLDATRGSWHRY